MCYRAVHNLARPLLSFAAILLILLAGWGGTGAAMPGHLAAALAGPLEQVVICAQGQASTVWLDAEGNEHPAPQDCRDCPICHPPALTDNPPPDLPAAVKQWQRSDVILAAPQRFGTDRPVPVLPRGPPSPSHAWTVLVPSPAGDSPWPEAECPRRPKRGVQAIAMDARA